jgi:hypothetical protein
VKTWIGHHGRQFAVPILTVLGTLLVIHGVIELPS